MKFLFYLFIIYLFYSILKKIMHIIKSANNHDMNTNYSRNQKRRTEKREIIEADFEEIKEKK